jgi:glucose-1-phosphate adenylyltransferase
MKTDPTQRIVRFVEKPKADDLAGLESAVAPEPAAQGRVYLASMGIYVFERDVLVSLLREHAELNDFGRDVIPFSVPRLPVFSYPFDGYWTDIGTVESFFEANLALCDPLPRLDLYDADRPIYTHARMLPPSKTRGAIVHGSILGQGCVLEDCAVRRCVIGVRAWIGGGSALDECVVMGADHYESLADRQGNVDLGRPHVGIGEDSSLQRVIVDKNARIGRNVVMRGWPDRPDADGPGWHVRDGIVIVPKDATVPDGTEV